MGTDLAYPQLISGLWSCFMAYGRLTVAYVSRAGLCSGLWVAYAQWLAYATAYAWLMPHGWLMQRLMPRGWLMLWLTAVEAACATAYGWLMCNTSGTPTSSSYAACVSQHQQAHHHQHQHPPLQCPLHRWV